MANTRDTGFLRNLISYDASNNITLPANLIVNGTITGYATTSYVATQLGGYVPTTRTISINGTSLDLSTNRSFTINSMVYPGAGIAVSTGSTWGTSLTDNSSNWNTAFGWGNHAIVGYLTGITSGQVTTALGFTPYNATNPTGYITSAALSIYATQSYVGTQIANLVASAPAALDTLNELAAALGNDPSFATTVSTSIGTKVPQARTITINGTTYDLTANRSWTITSMIYPAAGIVLSTGTAWGTSITDNSANWNTAYGWGNHASGGYLTSALAATTYASLTGAYANPAFVASLAYSKITGVPAFLTSYTETDPYRVTTVAVSGTSTKTITLTRADASTVTTTWTDIDTDTNTYVTSAGFSGGNLTLTRNDAGTVTVSLDGRYYLASNPSSYITSSSLSGYVPYTGATANIDTGGYSITAGAVTLTSNLWLKNTGTYDFIISNAASLTTNTVRVYYTTSDELRFYAKNTAGSSVVPKIMVGDGTTFYTLYHSANIPTWNQNTTGTAASISGFNNPTAAATANTIAYRDGSGHITGNYGFYSYINTTDNVETGTITYIMAKFGDNYHRSATAAKVQAFLGLGSLAYSSATIPTNLNQLTNGPGYITGVTNISGYSTYLNTRYDGGSYANPQQYFGQSIGLRVAMTGAWSVWSDTLWINGYNGGDVLQMCALHTLRNGTPRMAISVQACNQASYGTFYEFITAYNIASQSVSYATTAGNAATAGGLAVHTGRNNEANKIVRTQDNGYIHCGYINSSNGNENNNANADRVWGTNGSDDYLRTYRTSALSVGYAATAGSAPANGGNSSTVGGYSVSTAGSANTIPTRNASGYLSPENWIQLNGNYGLYFPNSYGLHFYPNTDGSYGPAQILGEKNGWRGLHFGGGTGITLMMNEGEFGFHRQAVGWVARFTSGRFYGASDNVYNLDYAIGNSHYWTGIQYLQTNNGGQAINNSNSAKLQAYSTGNNSAFMSFHKGGYYAVNFGLDDDNWIRIGGWSAAANRFQFNTVSGDFVCNGDVTAFSDARVKENIVTVDNALNKVLALRGVYYNRIDSEDKSRKIGVIAQETLPILPEVVNTDAFGTYNVSYGNIGGLFIEAFKEQNTIIKDQAEVIKGLQEQIDELKILIYGITR